MKRTFRKILIANRGEIALRILRAARSEGMQVVAVFAEDERNAAHVTLSDEAYSLESGSLADTYLNIDKMIAIAQKCGAQAIHPGYGFLSENADFAAACQRAGLVFIGPSAEVLTLMGNKITAKDAARSVGIPVLETVPVQLNPLKISELSLSFPVLIKAAHGGGGKGMQVVHSEVELAEKLEKASRSAANYFGNGEVYVEPYLENARHIEVQILGDLHGNLVHLYERDCTMQRNHQKIIEEAPAVALSSELRERILDAALRLGRSVGYVNAGTVEFLVTPTGAFYFLEMNPRVQVEHTVTEQVTGVDIVREQLRIAAGNALSFAQADVRLTGHAIQARVYTEAPQHGFRPDTSPLLYTKMPESQAIRVETDLINSGSAATQYDPLACKIIASAQNRQQAINELILALQQTVLLGADTNLSFLLQLLNSEAFQSNEINTHYIDNQRDELLLETLKLRSHSDIRFLLSAFVYGFAFHSVQNKKSNRFEFGFWRHVPVIDIQFENQKGSAFFMLKTNILHIQFNEFTFETVILNRGEHALHLEIEGVQKWVYFVEKQGQGTILQLDGHVFLVSSSDRLSHHPEIQLLKTDENQVAGNIVNSPLHGKIVEINIQSEQEVKQGDLLLVIEAMKSENRIFSPKKGIVKSIMGRVGDQVADGMPLVLIEDQ